MFEFGFWLIVKLKPSLSDIEDQNVSLSVFVDMLLIVKLLVAFYLGNSKEYKIRAIKFSSCSFASRLFLVRPPRPPLLPSNYASLMKTRLCKLEFSMRQSSA